MKIKKIILSLGTLLMVLRSIVTLGQSCAPLPSGALGWWQGENNTYDVITGTPGSLIEGTTYAPGEVGDGFSFNGSSGGVDVAPTSAMNIDVFTIEAWIQRANASQTSSTSPGGGAIVSHGANSWAFVVSDDGPIYVTQVYVNGVNSSLGVTDTNFHHVAVTADGTNVTFYVDGVADTPIAYAPAYAFTQPVYIGANPNEDAVFQGVIDEPTIYDRALSAVEIQAIYQAGSAGKCATLQILVQPSNVVAQPGENVTFSVGAVGGRPLSYQWRSNTVAISGDTNATIVLTNVTLADSGATYSVIVANGDGRLLSSNADLTVSNFPCVLPLPGLVGWWPADGSTADLTTRDDGVFTGSATYAPGVNGSAFYFTNEGDSVLVGNSPALQLQNFTIEGWIQRSDPEAVSHRTDGGLIFSYGGYGYGFGMVNSGAMLLSEIGISGTIATGGFITDLMFHHVAVTTTNATVTFYLDGQPVSANSYGAQFQFDGSAAIGCRGDGLGTFLGSIDDLSVYNRALTAAEILELYNRHAALKCIEAPVIVNQPLSQTNIANSDVTFGVGVASVLPTTYQWQMDETNLPAATNDVLSLVGLDDAMAGTYSVIVSNSLGYTVSSNALLVLAQPVTISNQPQSQVVVLGAAAAFSVTAGGTAPLSYQWQFMSANIPGATSPTYAITNIALANLGAYRVIVSNPWSAVTSDPANLAVNPEILVNGQLGTNFGYTNAAVEIQIISTFTNTAIFYTLDGSTPDYNATYYSGPFNLTQSAIVQAVAYDTNFNSVESVAVNVIVIISNSLQVINPGGGTVTLNPPGGTYRNSQTVQVTATPANGWVFLNWSGTVSGTDPVIDVSMLTPQTVRAAFGTSFSIKSPPTNGSIQFDPASGPYPYGSFVQVIAVPAQGYAFSLWGGSLSGVNNPYGLEVTAPSPSVAALFSALAPNHFSVTAIPNGNGSVALSPAANSYISNSSVILSAASAGSRFYYWTGSVTSSVSRLTLLVRSNMVITGNFSNGVYPVQFSSPQMVSHKLQFSLQGAPLQIYDVDVSTDLLNWALFDTVTNTTGSNPLFDYTTNQAARFYRAVSP